MQEPVTTDPRQQQWPGVIPAYDWVRPSYELTERRNEAISNRLRSFLTLAITLSFGAPAFAKAIFDSAANYRSPWLLLALACGALAAFIAVSAQVGGSMTVLDPRVMYRETLRLTEWQFKLNALENIDRDFARNLGRVNRKGHLADAVGYLILVEFAFLLGWLLTT